MQAIPEEILEMLSKLSSNPRNGMKANILGCKYYYSRGKWKREGA